MYNSAFALACLACAVQASSRQWKNPDAQDYLRQFKSTGQANGACRHSSPKLLARMLLTLSPLAAFRPSKLVASVRMGTSIPVNARVASDICMHLPPIQRRQGLALCACSLAAMLPMAPANARLDGIPGYAPADKLDLPTFGFETQLPRMEQIRDKALPLLRKAVTAADWKTCGILVGEGLVDFQVKAIGATAAILADDAYDAMESKKEYVKNMDYLRKILAGDPPDQEAALRTVDKLERAVYKIMAFIPEDVVKKVRKVERKRAKLAAKQKEQEKEQAQAQQKEDAQTQEVVTLR